MGNLAYIIVLLVLIYHAAFVHSACDLTRAAKCIEDAGIDNSNSNLPAGDPKTFCRVQYPTITGCLDTSLGTCASGSEGKLLVDGSKDSLNYLCSDEGLSLFIKHQTCLNQRTVFNAVKECRTQLQQEVRNRRSGDDVCVLFQNVRSCVRRAGSGSGCGEEAGQFLEQVVYKAMEAALREHFPKCSIGGRAAPTIMTIAFGTILALLLGRLV